MTGATPKSAEPTSPIPGFGLVEVHRRVVEDAQIDEIRDSYEAGLAAAADSCGSESRAVAEVVSAWGVRCDFVRSAFDALVPKIRAALETSSEAGRELGEPVDATLFTMDAHSRGGTHAHQDIAYKWNRPLQSRYAYTSWLALTRCGPSTGALRFSQAMPATPVTARQDFLRDGFVDLSATDRWTSDERVVETLPGDLVVFDACCWHASAPYLGDGRRLALAIRWTATSRWEQRLSLGAPPNAEGSFGMDTAGACLGRAIAGACGLTASTSPQAGHAHRLLIRLLQRHGDVTAQLSDRALTALRRLELALRLQANHGARPAAHVWIDARDVAIPELTSLANGGAA